MGILGTIYRSAKAGHAAGKKYEVDSRASGKKSTAGGAMAKGAKAALKTEGPGILRTLFRAFR